MMATAQHSPRQELHAQKPIYLLEEQLGHGAFGIVNKAVDVSSGDVYVAKTFYRGDWKKEVDILMNLSHVSVITELMINPWLTFRKGVYYKIRGILRGTETYAGHGISTPWQLSLSIFYH